MARELDIVVFGATGFVGRLVAGTSPSTPPPTYGSASPGARRTGSPRSAPTSARGPRAGR